jgi:hypothetical protein
LCVDQYAAEELQTPPHVALLVVDSIAMAVHRHFCKEGDMPRRQSAVIAHAAALKRLADAHATTVLCVNHVSGGARGHGPAAEGDCAHVTGLEDEQLGCEAELLVVKKALGLRRGMHRGSGGDSTRSSSDRTPVSRRVVRSRALLKMESSALDAVREQLQRAVERRTRREQSFTQRRNRYKYIFRCIL